MLRCSAHLILFFLYASNNGMCVYVFFLNADFFSFFTFFVIKKFIVRTKKKKKNLFKFKCKLWLFTFLFSANMANHCKMKKKNCLILGFSRMIYGYQPQRNFAKDEVATQTTGEREIEKGRGWTRMESFWGLCMPRLDRRPFELSFFTK